MAYIVPRAEIEQQFTQVPVFTEQPLAALIIGPQYKLFRYDVAAEKSGTVVEHPTVPANGNSYIPGSSIAYAYTNKASNAIVDQDYVKVFFEDALVEYFPNATTDGAASATVAKVGSYTNRIRSSSLILKTANSYNRSAVFSNRDVAIGDTVIVTNGAGGGTTITSKVKSLIAEVVAASIGTLTNGADNSGDYVAADDLVASGTYTGTTDITYKVLIERGGPFYTGSNAATCARAKITSNDVDSSVTVNIADDTNFDVGTLGVQLKIVDNTEELSTGDVFYIPVTAATVAQVRTIELEDNLNTDQLDGGASLTMKLQLPEALVEIPRIRSLADGTFNWVPDEEDVTINSAITTTNDSIVNGDDLVALPIKAASIFVEHRDLQVSSSVSIGSVTSTSDVEAKLGTIHPDNELAQGVYNAVLNSANVVVYYGAVPTDDLSGYNKILELAKKNNKYYSLVPLTYDATIHDAIVGHVNAMSTAAQAKWRIAWLAKEIAETELVYDLKTNGTAWLGTVSDDPTAGGTQYTLVTIAGAQFITDGVRPGDELLYDFHLGALGEIEYSTVEIAEVRTQTTLEVVTAFDAAISSSIKMQIRRNYTADEQAANAAAVIGSYDNRRVRVVFPDEVLAGSIVENGYQLAAALAGLRSGVVPHQGLTNIEILGFTDLPKVINGFTEEQLNVIAEEGAWIVTQNALGATPYTRHQLTTDESGLNFSEDSITTNVDSISYALQAALAPFIGVYNVNAGNVLAIRAAIDAVLSFRMTNTFNARAGNQLNGYTIKKVAQNADFKDRIDVEVELQVPSPINVVKLTLIV